MANADVKPTTTTINYKAAITECFGAMPDDVIANIKGASDTHAWLASLFRAIENEAESQTLRVSTLRHSRNWVVMSPRIFVTFTDAHTKTLPRSCNRRA